MERIQLMSFFILLHVFFYPWTLGFDFLFAVYVVMENVAIVGKFGAVFGCVDLGGADVPNGIEFFVDIAVDEKGVGDVWIAFDTVFDIMIFATHIIKSKQRCAVGDG